MSEGKKIANLILEGGGVDALAYAGFLSKAEGLGLLELRALKK